MPNNSLIPRPGDWTEQAACLNDWPVFSNPDRYQEAKRICAECPVVKQCFLLAVAEEKGEPVGMRENVRGGLTPLERWNVEKQRCGTKCRNCGRERGARASKRDASLLCHKCTATQASAGRAIDFAIVRNRKKRNCLFCGAELSNVNKNGLSCALCVGASLEAGITASRTPKVPNSGSAGSDPYGRLGDLL
jgi:hypothetical protein